MQSGQRSLPSVGGQEISALNDINPNDIQSIEVVKGPAAATLYGADASAGVIQIITKRGLIGESRFTQNISTEYATIDPNFTPRPIYGTCTAANVAAGSGRVLCEGQPVGTVVSDNYLVRTGAFDNGQMVALNYSGQGAGDLYSFFISAGTNDETGTTSDTEAKRRTGRVNFRWLASDKITADATFGIIKNDYRLPKGDQDSFGYLIAQGLSNPTTVTAGPNGTLVGGTSQTNEGIRNILSESASLRLMPSVQVQFNPVSWLTNRLTAGADLTGAGVRIYEWQPCNLHAKTLVVDGRWSAVGTMNFDNRSLSLNDEVALLVLDSPFDNRMNALFMADLGYALEITLEAFRMRPRFRRLGEVAGQLINRLL